jgi:hypothetical protein
MVLLEPFSEAKLESKHKLVMSGVEGFGEKEIH